MEKAQRIAKVIAWLILGFIAAILCGAAIAVFYTNESFRTAVQTLINMLNGLSSILAVASVFLGVHSIRQANNGSKQVKEIISQVQGVSATLGQDTVTLNRVATSFETVVKQLNDVSASLTEVTGKQDRLFASMKQVSSKLNEAAAQVKALYDLQCQGVDMGQLRKGSPTGDAQQSGDGSATTPTKEFGVEKDPAT